MHYLDSNRSNIVFAEEKDNTVQALQDSFREVSKKILPSSVEVHATGVIKQSFPIPFFFLICQNLILREKAIGQGLE